MTIEAAPRTVLGKQVRHLRREGRLPANVYGKAIASRAIEIDAREFARTIKSAGLRAMIELKVEGETAPRYVILRGIARAHGTGEPIHVDFFQVDPERQSAEWQAFNTEHGVRTEAYSPLGRQKSDFLSHP
ncbi:MAG: hypothetical protein WHT63_07915, partial [Tepidiforma sp.]